jgi:NADH dehydrogenase (ubiquinone) Fe-S protein 1
MIIVGSSALERADGDAVLDNLKTIVNKTGIIKDTWNGFNVLHRDVGRINALEVGITPKRSNVPPKVVVLLGSDNNLDPSLIPKESYVIYIGHNGDEGAYYADLILPAAAYTEKNGTFVKKLI